MGVKQAIWRFVKSNRFKFALGTTVGGVYGVTPAICDALEKGELGKGLGYIIVIPFVVIGVWVSIPADPLPAVEETKRFKPFQDLDKDKNENEIWDRKSDEEELLKRIKSGGGGVVFLVGASGVGKSQLLRTVRVVSRS